MTSTMKPGTFSGMDDIHHETRDLYLVSMQLKHHVEHAAMKSATSEVRPPEAKDMSLEKAEEIVQDVSLEKAEEIVQDMSLEKDEEIGPTQLFNALAWIVGAASEVEYDSFVKVSDNDRGKLLSVCQDIWNIAHKGKLFLPKYFALGMTVRHLCGSSNTIGHLNGLGHSMSHIPVLEHDTALAAQQLTINSEVPDGFIKKRFISFTNPY